MNLGQNEAQVSLKAFVRNFNTQNNATPKVNKFLRKCIFLGGLQNWVVDLVQFEKMS